MIKFTLRTARFSALTFEAYTQNWECGFTIDLLLLVLIITWLTPSVARDRSEFCPCVAFGAINSMPKYIFTSIEVRTYADWVQYACRYYPKFPRAFVYFLEVIPHISRHWYYHVFLGYDCFWRSLESNRKV